MTDNYRELIEEARNFASQGEFTGPKDLIVRLADALESLMAEWYDSILKAGALQDERDALTAQIAAAKEALPVGLNSQSWSEQEKKYITGMQGREAVSVGEE